MPAIKKLFFYYQRAMWYMSQAKGEIFKPLQFWNETLLILTFLSVRGIDIGAKWAITAYAIIFISVVFFGILIVKLGMVSYNQHLMNSQNPELLEIKQKVNELLDLIKNK